MELDELLDQLLWCHRGAGRERKAPHSLPTACLSTELSRSGCRRCLRLTRTHSYALVRVTAGALEVLLEAEVGDVRFFSQPTAWEAKHAGPGGRVGQLLLWSCGFTPAGRTANSGTSSAAGPTHRHGLWWRLLFMIPSL
eukprot:jgi/Chrpa1/22617/Chrysochromulina_OHIO_Genome00026461-RA